MQSAYRPDIDGLRAVAILPVLGFHANIPGLTGGFVGVDIFFVISGYLITLNLHNSLQLGSYSIADFYERRVKRIFPALFVMLLINLLVCSILFLPADFKLLPGATLAALFFFSNIDLAGKVDYFAPDLTVQPLMHSWSLSVEEQYYLLFPLLLWLLYKFARSRLGLALFAVALMSFIYNMLLVRDNATIAYFSTPARIWELLAGSMLAVGFLPQITARTTRTALAISGMVLIIFSIYFFDEKTMFPGVAALAPVGGAVLLIHCAQGTSVGKLLASRWLVAIGLVSYSLYLWHWPVIVWTGYVSDRAVTGTLSIFVLAATAICAVLSYQYVERPGRKLRSRNIIFGSAAVSTSLIAGLAVLANISAGWPQRFNPAALNMASYATAFSPQRSKCHLGDNMKLRFLADCALGARVAPSAAVLGDSHGVELSYALGEHFDRQNRSIMQMTYSSCPPGIGRFADETDGCSRFRSAALKYLKRHTEIETVFLAGHLDIPQYRVNAAYFSAYRTLVEDLLRMGKKIVLVYPVPEQDVSGPRLLALRAQWHRPFDSAGLPEITFQKRMTGVLAHLDEIKGVDRINPSDHLCSGGRCRLAMAGFPAYYDDNHLSLPAMRRIVGLELN